MKQLPVFMMAFAFALSGISPVRSADDVPSLSGRIDSTFADYDTRTSPGCAVGVIHKGQYVHAKGYGMANLEHDVPIGLDSVFRIGSVSKQFTAFAITLLATRGELDLDADIHEYLPELRDYQETVTIRQMLHHISGMGEYEGETVYEIAEGKPFRFGNEDYWSISEFFDEVKKQPLIFKPGEKYEYSNIAYFLLSQVVERVSGLSLRQYAAREIFGPLGMDRSFFNDNVDGIVRNRADGYRPLVDGGYEIYMTNLDWVGDGGVFTTLNDFIKWDRAFMGGELPGAQQTKDMMLQPHPVTFGREDGLPGESDMGYGFGIRIGRLKGLPVQMHSGSWVGYRAHYARFPENDFSVITFCNREDALSDPQVDALLSAVIATYGKK